MNIDRNVNQGDTAKERVKFCLNQLEKSDISVSKFFQDNQHILPHLSMEEMVGALVSAEQFIDEATAYNSDTTQS